MTKPVLARSTDYGRGYLHPVTGEFVPSVTTIISAGIPKPALVGWAAKSAAQYAAENWESLTELSKDEKIKRIKGTHRQIAKEAAGLGDTIHDIVDKYNKGLEPGEWPPGSHENQFIGFLMDCKPRIIESETTVWSRKHGYAGTLDFIARIRDRVWLSDLKTGSGLYPEMGLQLSALAHADFIIREDGTEESVPQVDGCALLHLRSGFWKFVPLTWMEECFTAFLHCKGILQWSQDNSPTVIGEAMFDGKEAGEAA